MNEKSELVKCKELILYKFKIDDLKHCLHGVSCNASGKKDDLQRRLRNILESEKTQRKAINVVLGRGIDMGYMARPDQGNFTDISTTKSFSKPNNHYIQHENTIHMKNLYFYKDIQNITGWKIIRSNDINQSVFLNFTVSKDLYKSFISLKENDQPMKCCFLRCTKIEQNIQDVPLNDCYPVLMRMFVNGQEFTSHLPREICYSSVDKKNRLPVPTVLNEPLKKIVEPHYKDGSVKIELRFDRDANKNDSFAFAVFTSTLKTVQEICQEIISKKKVTFEKFDSDLKKFMSTSEDVALECAKIPLCSSITYRTIKIPFRGKNCNHISPDDLEDYIQINKNSEAWLCKICKHICTPDDMMIDEFFMDVLNKHSTIDGIELYPGMKYKLYGGNEILTIGKSIGTKKNKTDDVSIILIDSDDEIDVLSDDRNASRSQCKNEVNFGKPIDTFSSNIGQIECITIDDSSDDEPLQKRIRNIFCEEFKPENEVSQSVVFNSDPDTNIAISNELNVSNDSFVSDPSLMSNSSLIHHSEKNLTNSTENVSMGNSFKRMSFEYIGKAIEKINEKIQNDCPVFDEFINGIVGENLYNIDKILDQEIKDGMLPKSHLSLKPLYINKDLQNTVDIHPMMPFISGNSNIEQYLKVRDDQLSDLKKFVNEIDKTYGYINPSTN